MTEKDKSALQHSTRIRHSVMNIESQLQDILAEEHQLLAGDVFLRGSFEHLERQNTMIIQLLRELLRVQASEKDTH